MPLFATLALNFIVGALASLAAARELRASPRAVHHTRGFQALTAHALLIATPIATLMLVRGSDWMVSYALDGSRIPSALTVALVAMHGGLALGGYALGARLIRDHRGQWVRTVVIVAVAAVILAAFIARDRLGVVGTTAQYRGGFGLRSFWGSRVAGISAGLAAAWIAAAGHLLWSLARRL